MEARDLLDEIDLARQVGPEGRHRDASVLAALVDGVEPERRQERATARSRVSAAPSSASVRAGRSVERWSARSAADRRRRARSPRCRRRARSTVADRWRATLGAAVGIDAALEAMRRLGVQPEPLGGAAHARRREVARSRAAARVVAAETSLSAPPMTPASATGRSASQMTRSSAVERALCPSSVTNFSPALGAPDDDRRRRRACRDRTRAAAGRLEQHVRLVASTTLEIARTPSACRRSAHRQRARPHRHAVDDDARCSAGSPRRRRARPAPARPPRSASAAAPQSAAQRGAEERRQLARDAEVAEAVGAIGRDVDLEDLVGQAERRREVVAGGEPVVGRQDRGCRRATCRGRARPRRTACRARRCRAPPSAPSVDAARQRRARPRPRRRAPPGVGHVGRAAHHLRRRAAAVVDVDERQLVGLGCGRLPTHLGDDDAGERARTSSRPRPRGRPASAGARRRPRRAARRPARAASCSETFIGTAVRSARRPRRTA